MDIKRSAITMKKFLNIMLCIMGSLLAVIVVFGFCISYRVNYKKTICDTSVSPDGDVYKRQVHHSSFHSAFVPERS